MQSKTIVQLTIATMMVLTLAGGAATAAPVTPSANGATSVVDSPEFLGVGVLLDGGYDECEYYKTFKPCEPDDPEP